MSFQVVKRVQAKKPAPRTRRSAVDPLDSLAGKLTLNNRAQQPPRQNNYTSSAGFRNIPQDVVRQHIVGRLNAQSAARFAAASKEYRNTARARVQVARPEDPAIITKLVTLEIDKLARKVAGKLTQAVAHSRKLLKQGGTDKQQYESVTNIPPLGSVEVMASLGRFSMFPGSTDTIYVTIPKGFVAELHLRVERRNRRARYMLHIDLIMRDLNQHRGYPFTLASPARLWMLRTVLHRAVEMYNEHPVSFTQ